MYYRDIYGGVCITKCQESGAGEKTVEFFPCILLLLLYIENAHRDGRFKNSTHLSEGHSCDCESVPGWGGRSFVRWVAGSRSGVVDVLCCGARSHSVIDKRRHQIVRRRRRRRATVCLALLVLLVKKWILVVVVTVHNLPTYLPACPAAIL